MKNAQGVLSKVVYFVLTYGIVRTAFKIIGRSERLSKYFRLPVFGRQRGVAVIGCGQYARSTISYFLYSSSRCRVVACYDLNGESAKRMAQLWPGCYVAQTSADAINHTGVDIVFIASNHHSHTDYFCDAVRAKKLVHVEKPPFVNFAQYRAFSQALISDSKPGQVMIGFNRPHSVLARKFYNKLTPSVTMTATVFGHQLPKSHWYRNDAEGLRICGNLGHWIDLFVHLLQGQTAGEWSINFVLNDSSGCDADSDDNFVVVLRAPNGALASISLVAKQELVTGIYEVIAVQGENGSLIIDDYKSYRWIDSVSNRRESSWHKDVGHKVMLISHGKDKTQREAELVDNRTNQALVSAYITLIILQMCRARGESLKFCLL